MLRCPPAVAGPVQTRLDAIKQLCSQVTGTPVRVELVTDEPPAPAAAPADADAPEQAAPEQAAAPESAPPARPAPPAAPAPPAPPTDADKDAIVADPLVQEALDLFGARIIDVMPAPKPRNNEPPANA